MSGPLTGLTVIELAGIGPGPVAGMMLADMGARVIRVDRMPRPGQPGPVESLLKNDSIVDRGRESIALDLKSPGAVETVLRLVERADVLIEGYRPGTTEKLGLGPDVCLARNARLVYGRMTGWGQTGPLAMAAGHDLNYIAISGALHPIGPADRPPPPPLNLVGDYGGGAMLLVVGVLAALHESRRSGQGQVVDAAMSDGAAQLMSGIWGMVHKGGWNPGRGENFLDGCAPFYGTYACADGQYVSIGPIEPAFWRDLLQRLAADGVEVDPAWSSRQWDRATWVDHREALAALFARRTRAQWCALLEGSDACFAPVLAMDEAPNHPHNQARETYTQLDGRWVPAPAPRFSRTPSRLASAPPEIGRDTASLLAECGYDDAEIQRRFAAGHVAQARP